MNPVVVAARLAVVAAAGCLCGCSEAGPAKPAPRNQAAAPVKALRVTTRPIERTLTATGWLVAREHATLSVKVSGRLKNIAVDLGSVVQTGDVIAQIEPRDYELRLQQAAAALAQARAALGLPLEGQDDSIAPEQTTVVRQAKAVRDEAARNVERLRNLARAGITSQSELDTAEANHTVAREQFEGALQEARTRQATLAQRRAEFELARQQLTDTTVRAPFAGTVQARLANVGEFLSGGAPVATLVQIDPLRVRLEIAERDARLVRVGQAVRLRVEGSVDVAGGSITRLSPALNEANRMLVVEADLPNRGGMRPGVFARADIVLDPDEPAMAVPASALIVFAGLEKVVVANEGVAQERVITTGRRANGWIEVLSGIQEGDWVILDPGGVRTGHPVNLTETEFNPIAQPGS